jgi:hypothetical protein
VQAVRSDQRHEHKKIFVLLHHTNCNLSQISNRKKHENNTPLSSFSELYPKMSFLQDHQSSNHSKGTDEEDEEKSAWDSSNVTTSNPEGRGEDTSHSGSSFERKAIGKENRAVLRSKAVVLLVICVVAAAFATATYFLTANAETTQFESK